ncbi:MAG: hypothetical protein J7K21_00895 [Desulfurococcales archaeon]|nr:hypothetical protein [Desulfurococcales archaeon]
MFKLPTRIRVFITAWKLKHIVWDLERKGLYKEAEEELIKLSKKVEKWQDSPEKHEVMAFIKTRLANIKSLEKYFNKAFISN